MLPTTVSGLPERGQPDAATGSSPGPATDGLRALLRSGRVREALTALVESVDEAGATIGEADVAGPLALLLDCRLARGELAEAFLVGERLRPYAAGAGTSAAVAGHALGDLAAAGGDHEGALDLYRCAGLALEPVDDDADLVPWRTGAALALVRLGQRRSARDLAVEQLAVARERGPAYGLAQALRTAATTVDDGSRQSLLREARGLLAGPGMHRLLAQIDTDLAVVLVLHGGSTAHTEAVALLRSAERYAAREELGPLLHRVRATLERVGESPLLDTWEALATLTPAQRTAARLAADGHTNREIAERLGVSVKAVEWNLSHVYRKLGVPNRAGLALTLGSLV